MSLLPDFLVLFLLPALLLWAEKRLSLIRLLSPAFFCYALGIVWGNVADPSSEVVKPVMEAGVGLAIPLLLFSAQVKTWLRLARKTLLSYGLYLIAVGTSTTFAYFIFSEQLPEAQQAAAMAASVYSGGTANMGAMQLATHASEQLFGAMNMADLLLSGAYLVLLLPFGQRILRLFLPAFEPTAAYQENEQADTNHFPQLPLSRQIQQVLISLLLAMLVLGSSAGISWLFFGKLVESFLIMSITILGVFASLLPRIRTLPATYPTGQYVFLIFCVGVGSLVDLDLLAGHTLSIIGFMAIVAYGGIALHACFAYWFRLDADTVLMTNVAGIFGPPFIGPVASSMHNREIVLTGLSLAVINLAIGNFVGLLVFWSLGG